jgi:glycerophosphoryl diester phosphodiesterase
MSAYERAVADGADAVECDVRLTADGVLVCVHDRRIDRTSTGRGPVSSQTYAQLSQADYGSWKQTPEEMEAEEEEAIDAGGLLRLSDLLDFLRDVPRRVDISIETKHPVRYGGLVEDRLVDLLRERDLVTHLPGRGRVRLMSFSETALRRMRELAPTLQTVFLMDRVPVRARNGWLPSRARIAGPGMHVLRAHPHFVERLHSAGRLVHVWTVDEPADIDLCIELGVDGIITNRPAEVLARLGR